MPTVIQIFGLDGYTTEFAKNAAEFNSRGWAAVAVEIPGTGDSPALPNDPKSPDRLWSSLLDWLEGQQWVEKTKIVAWGLSTGGYYAMRIAHTHKDRLLAVVAQGGGCHHMFDPEWLSNVGHMEYPFEYASPLAVRRLMLTHLANSSLDVALAAKFGYDGVESLKQDSQKRFSLLENGILDQRSTTLLIVNVRLAHARKNLSDC